MDNSLVPAQVPNPKVVSVGPAELPDAPVTDGEADAAARELGLTFFKSSKSKALKKIGAFTAQQGVVHLGAGRLAATDEALQNLLEIAVEIASDEEEQANDRVGAIAAGKGVAEVIQRSIEMMVEFQTEKLLDGPKGPKRRSFVDEGPVVPITAQNVQVNIDTGPKSQESK